MKGRRALSIAAPTRRPLSERHDGHASGSRADQQEQLPATQGSVTRHDSTRQHRAIGCDQRAMMGGPAFVSGLRACGWPTVSTTRRRSCESASHRQARKSRRPNRRLAEFRRLCRGGVDVRGRVHRSSRLSSATRVRGWRASAAGEQRIRLVFEQPQRIRRIEIELDEPVVARRRSSCRAGPPMVVGRSRRGPAAMELQPGGAAHETRTSASNSTA